MVSLVVWWRCFFLWGRKFSLWREEAGDLLVILIRRHVCLDNFPCSLGNFRQNENSESTYYNNLIITVIGLFHKSFVCKNWKLQTKTHPIFSKFRKCVYWCPIDSHLLAHDENTTSEQRGQTLVWCAYTSSVVIDTFPAHLQHILRQRSKPGEDNFDVFTRNLSRRKKNLGSYSITTNDPNLKTRNIATLCNCM